MAIIEPDKEFRDKLKKELTEKMPQSLIEKMAKSIHSYKYQPKKKEDKS